MKCPKCDSEDSGVTDSRATEQGLRRRRKCADCSERFTTYELNAEEIPGLTFKADGGVSRVWRVHRDELATILETVTPEDRQLLLSLARRLIADASARRAA